MVNVTFCESLVPDGCQPEAKSRGGNLQDLVKKEKIQNLVDTVRGINLDLLELSAKVLLLLFTVDQY